MQHHAAMCDLMDGMSGFNALWYEGQALSQHSGPSNDGTDE